MEDNVMELPMTMDSRDFYLLERAQKFLKRDTELFVYDNKDLIIEGHFYNGFIVTCDVNFRLQELKTITDPNGFKIHEIAQALLSITEFNTPEGIIEARRQSYGAIEAINGELKATICFAITFMSEEYAKEIDQEGQHTWSFKWKTKK